MLQQWSTSEIKIKLNKLEFKLRQVFKEAWPIRWTYFKQPKTVVSVLGKSAYSLKAAIVSLFLAVIISFSFLVYSLYLSMTVEVAAQGGELREAVVGGEMNIFNPVFDPRSTAESKVTNLLYLPLYEVQYPDFLSGSTFTPNIKPILLEKEPEWIDSNEEMIENRFKVMRFSLRDNIKWSDGSSITLADMEYTINRLKEERGNSLFRDVMAGLTYEKLSEKEFLLRSAVSNPQLIYLLNFRPIPQTYFDFEDNDGLFTDPRTRRPTVTSGYFRFPAGEVQNPNDPRGEMVDNPIRDSNGRNVAVVLEKNPVSNTSGKLFVDKYILTRYDSITEVPGESQTSLKRASESSNVDLYTRFLGSDIDTNLTPDKVSDELNLDQKVVPSNTYYTAYFNIAQGIRANYVGYLINQSLRKYIACHLLDYQPNTVYSNYIDSIPREKRLVPLHFNQNYNLDCGDKNAILDSAFYKIESDQRTGIKRVILNNDSIQLTMIGLSDTKNLLTDLQIYFRDQLGIPVDLITDPTDVNNRLNNGEFNIAVLPIKMVIADPKPLYGSSGRNLTGINLNSRVENYKVNEKLDLYSISQLSNEEAKNGLVDFFTKEFVSVNLYRARQEYNYSDRARGLGKNLPEISTFADDIYVNVDSWYIDTRREWFWGADPNLRVET